VSCDPVKGTQTYVVECREHVDGNAWQQAKLSTKSRNDIAGLVSGKTYAFRIAAIGAAGQSPWSDEAVCMAP
jgi:Fibronectin type III domain